MRATIIAMMLMIGSQVAAECGNLCRPNWWMRATEADVQAELDGGADVNARNKSFNNYATMHAAAMEGTPASIKVLLDAGGDLMARDERGSTPLHIAAQCPVLCEPGVVEFLLDAGADISAQNKYGITALHRAINQGTIENVKTLLDRGANVMTRGRYGDTALHMAARETPKKIQIILAAGVDVMARSEDGSTPLHSAAGTGHLANVRLLLASGADVMALTERELTPLHSAARCYFCGTGAIQALLAAGADPKAKTNFDGNDVLDGKTPWDFAKQNERLKGTEDDWALNDAQYK